MANVLVVETAPLIRTMISSVLRDAGLQVTEFASAEAALDAAEAASFQADVLVTAVVLDRTGIDGLGLAALLRYRQPNLGVVYLAEQPGDINKDALDGRQRCLIKPFEPARLAKLVCELAPPCPNPPRLIRGRPVMH